jgi:hypothetical protein
MSELPEDDLDEEVVPIPMDRETRRMLVQLSQRFGMRPVRCAAELLRSLLSSEDAKDIVAVPRLKS